MKVDNPRTEIQVFAAVFNDGRKKPRMYLLRGKDEEEALSEKYEATEGKPILGRQNSDNVELKHLGNWNRFQVSAEVHKFDWYSGFTVPVELSEEVGNSKVHLVRDKARPKSSQKYNKAKA